MKLLLILLCLALCACNCACHNTVKEASSGSYVVKDTNGNIATVQFFEVDKHRFAVMTSSMGVAICEVTPDSLKPERE